jgi:hypothetical protein
MMLSFSRFEARDAVSRLHDAKSGEKASMVSLND